jgi:hypothetical protein
VDCNDAASGREGRQLSTKRGSGPARTEYGLRSRKFVKDGDKAFPEEQPLRVGHMQHAALKPIPACSSQVPAYIFRKSTTNARICVPCPALTVCVTTHMATAQISKPSEGELIIFIVKVFLGCVNLRLQGYHIVMQISAKLYNLHRDTKYEKNDEAYSTSGKEPHSKSKMSIAI